MVEVNYYGNKERRDKERWKPAIAELSPFVGRSYDTFSCLFGVRDYVPFEPVAPQRGFPENVTDLVRDRAWTDVGENGEYKSGFECHDATYVTLEELKNVDWDEESEGLDRRVAVVDDDGDYRFKAAYISGMKDLTDEQMQRLNNGENVEWGETDDGKRYLKRLRPTRRSVLSGAWEYLIFELMDKLGERFGDENVRLVVWFDN